MVRPRLRSPSQPLPVRGLLRTYEALASLKLAVVLISVAAGVLAWATLVERDYGAKAVHFGVYGTSWFAALSFLLGLNVLCAALIRFPWKRYQTGFVITHAGILVLLLGCYLTWLGGIDAQMPVFEQTAAHRAFADTQHFELTIQGSPAAAGRPPEAPSSSASPGGDAAGGDVIRIPFAAGPFNWADYSQLSWFPWRLVRRDRGVLFDRDGVRLEVLDYLSDSALAAMPPLKLQVKTRTGKTAPGTTTDKPSATAHGSKPSAESGPATWQAIELGVHDVPNPDSPHHRMGLGGRQELGGGQQVAFWVAESRLETEAFLNSQPDGPLGSKGQVVLFAAGKKHVLAVDSLEPGARVPLGDSGLQVELVQLDPRYWGLSLRVIAPGEMPARMMLLADYPEFNQQDEEHGVYGTYWTGPSAAQAGGSEEKGPGALRGLGKPRIDIVQGADRRLYFRVWRSPRLEAIGPLDAGGAQQVAFAGTDDQVAWYVEQFTPHDRPGAAIRPVPFSAKKSPGQKSRRALVRLTVDGSSEEFWLDGLQTSQFQAPPRRGERRTVHGAGRRASVMLAWDAVELGFQVYLQSFNRRLDPGTSMASHYSSLVDFLARSDHDDAPGPRRSEDARRVLSKDVLITLNEPVSFSDPRTGRSYRLFQESFNGPWRAGDDVFDEIVPAGSAKDQLFVSFLTVNYDPGRGLKYTGSLLIVAGVAVVFYMKGYFLRRRDGPRRVDPAA